MTSAWSRFSERKHCFTTNAPIQEASYLTSAVCRDQSDGGRGETHAKRGKAILFRTADLFDRVCKIIMLRASFSGSFLRYGTIVNKYRRPSRLVMARQLKLIDYHFNLFAGHLDSAAKIEIKIQVANKCEIRSSIGCHRVSTGLSDSNTKRRVSRLPMVPWYAS